MTNHHWCIVEGCRHGTLNGALALGSLYLAEYQKGYAAGFKDASQDAAMESKGHPYTCGLCNWGRDGEYHDYDEYNNHMSHIHPEQAIKNDPKNNP